MAGAAAGGLGGLAGGPFAPVTVSAGAVAGATGAIVSAEAALRVAGVGLSAGLEAVGDWALAAAQDRVRGLYQEDGTRVEAVDQALLAWAGTESVYRTYVQNYVGHPGVWIGYEGGQTSVMTALARVFNLNLTIYAPLPAVEAAGDEEEDLVAIRALKRVYESPLLADAVSVELLHCSYGSEDGPLNHFDRLEKTPETFVVEGVWDDAELEEHCHKESSGFVLPALAVAQFVEAFGELREAAARFSAQRAAAHGPSAALPTTKEALTAAIVERLRAEGATEAQIQVLLRDPAMARLVEQAAATNHTLGEAQAQGGNPLAPYAAGKKAGEETAAEAPKPQRKGEPLEIRVTRYRVDPLQTALGLFQQGAETLHGVNERHPTLTGFALSAAQLALSGPSQVVKGAILEVTGLQEQMDQLTERGKDWLRMQLTRQGRLPLTPTMDILIEAGGFGVAIGLSTLVGGKDKILKSAKDVKEKVQSYAGRSGRQTRLKALAKDPKLGAADKGWLKQEINAVTRKSARMSSGGDLKPQKNIRVPPGKELAHRRGKAAKDGYSYKHADLQSTDLHKLQHKYEGYK